MFVFWIVEHYNLPKGTRLGHFYVITGNPELYSEDDDESEVGSACPMKANDKPLQFNLAEWNLRGDIGLALNSQSLVLSNRNGQKERWYSKIFVLIK